MSKAKVLLVVEDYQHQIDMESLIRKNGWDVKSVKRDVLVKEQILSFNPDIIIASGRGRAINGIQLARRTQRFNGRPKFVLYISRIEASVTSLTGVPVDVVLENPFSPVKLLKMLCHLSGISDAEVLEKYEKNKKLKGNPVEKGEGHTHIRGEVESEEIRHITAKQKDSLLRKRNWIADEQRRQKYADVVKLVKEEELQQWDANFARKTAAKMKKESASEIEKAHLAKKKFVRLLFKKK